MEHSPVLLSECIENLNIKPDGIYIDGTLGRGGHSLEIAKRLEKGRLIAIDRDAEAILKAGKFLEEYKDRITFVKGNFGDISEILDSENIQAVDGMLFDFGVSSPQLDDVSRGFSYMADTALDMRMDTEGSLTAFEIINEWNPEELQRIFRQYGEERYASSIARAIVRKRETQPINSTFELNNVIFSAIPAAARREKQHPSKRCFQAIRISVNDELGAIEKMLGTAIDRLNPGGRLCAMSFHSLEDRLVKKAFTAAVSGCTCPSKLPVCVCGFEPRLKMIARKPITPTDAEIERNPRARSAKLRVAERI